MIKTPEQMLGKTFHQPETQDWYLPVVKIIYDYARQFNPMRIKKEESKHEDNPHEILSDLFDKYSDGGTITKEWFERLVEDFIKR
jgi:hypothetical protein